MADFTTPYASAPIPAATTSYVILLVAIYLIFFTQYGSLAMLAPFFPTSEAGMAIGQTAVGIVFAAYPFGTVLATPLPPLAMRTLGASSSISLGLLINGVATLGVGLLPILMGTNLPTMLAAALVCVRGVGGVGAALAEAGTFTVIMTAGFGSRLGTIMSMVEVVIGLAAAGGTFAGGVLYDLGASTPLGAFLLPFVVTASLTLALLPLVFMALPSDKLSEGSEDEAGTADAAEGSSATEAGAGPASLWVLPRVVTLASTLAGSGLVEAIFPTLPPVLEAHGLDTAQIGELLAMNSVAYMIGALGGGCLIDKWSTRSTRRLVMGAGWVVMGLSYACFGPLAALPTSGTAQVALIGLGMFGQGVGAGGIIVPSLPDAQAGLSTELDKATVCAVWNSCYSGGAAIGPVVAAALADTHGFGVMASALAGWSAVAVLALALAGQSSSKGGTAVAPINDAAATTPASHRGSGGVAEGEISVGRPPFIGRARERSM